MRPPGRSGSRSAIRFGIRPVETFKKIIGSRLTWEILVAVVVVCVVVGFFQDIAGWFGMTSRAVFDQEQATLQEDVKAKQETVDKAQERIGQLTLTTASKEQQVQQLSKAIAALTAARPVKTEVLKVDAQQIVTDRGMAAQIARVLGIQPDRVRFADSPCGSAASR